MALNNSKEVEMPLKKTFRQGITVHNLIWSKKTIIKTQYYIFKIHFVYFFKNQVNKINIWLLKSKKYSQKFQIIIFLILK